MRYGANQSNGALSVGRIPLRPYPLASSRRPPLPRHPHQWAPRLRDKFEGASSHQSMSNLSLTSTDGEFEYSTRTHGATAHESKPVFYDYSEDFENVATSLPEHPLSPILRRISSSLRSIIISDDCGTDDETANEAARNIIDFLRRSTMNETRHSNAHSLSQDNAIASHMPLADDNYQATATSCEPVNHAAARSSAISEYSQKEQSCLSSESATTDNEAAATDSQCEGAGHNTEDISDRHASETSSLDSPLQPTTPAFHPETISPELAGDEGQDMLHEGMPGKDHNTKDDDAVAKDTGDYSSRSEPLTVVIPRPELTSTTSTHFPTRYSFSRRDSRLFSLSSGLTDLASFVKYVDKHIHAPDLDQSVQREEDSEISGSQPVQYQGQKWKRGLTTRDVPAPPRKSSLPKRDEHSSGAMAISAGSADELQQYKVISTRSGPTLVPQPVSPAKMLRLKNSIPRLMKALPPLPDFDPAPDSPFGPLVPLDIEPFELSRLTDARSTLSDAVVAPKHHQEARKYHNQRGFDQTARKPRLRLKHAASFSTGQSQNLLSRNLEQCVLASADCYGSRLSVATDFSNAPIKRRLQIKVPRLTPASLLSEDTSTVKRHAFVDRSITISEIASSQPRDLFTGPRSHQADTLESNLRHVSTIKTNYQEPWDAGPKETSGLDPGQEARSGLQRASFDSSSESRPTTNATTEEVAHGEGGQSHFSQSSVTKTRHGLRKRISNLRSRIREPHQHQRSVNRSDPFDEHCEARHPLLQSRSLSKKGLQDTVPRPRPDNGSHGTASGRRFRSKLGKLMRGARHKFRVWTKINQRFG